MSVEQVKSPNNCQKLVNAALELRYSLLLLLLLLLLPKAFPD